VGSGPEWYLVEPPGWVPVPAASAPEVLDRRVILAESPGAFRSDMRAVSAPYSDDDDELSYVDVVCELDWYRSRIREEPVPSSPYPVERVWVEHRPGPRTGEPSPGEHPSGAPLASELDVPAYRPPRYPSGVSRVFDRVVALDAPPVRPPRRAHDVADLTGRRIVVVQPGGPVYHWRAASEPYTDREEGDVSVTICSEYDWYRWAITREPPRAEPCPIYLIWVE
jgi:hypothetical protein